MLIELGIYEHPHRKNISSNLGWKIACEQEKMPYKITDHPDCPVIVFDGSTPEWFDQFLKNGGIGIVTDCSPDILPFEVDFTGEAAIENVDLSDLGSSEARVPCIAKLYQGEGYGKIQVHEKRVIKAGIRQDEFPVVLYQDYGKGGCFFTGLPMSRLVTALGDTLRPTTNFSNFSERIVSVDKHHLLKAMREILIMAFHKRDLPYIHLGYFPADYQSALAFRIDVDGVFGENLLNISKSALKHGFILTIFVNKSLCENDENFVLRIDRSHEVGNHADVHNLFSDYDSNYQNIKNCKAWLTRLGFVNNPWFAAPRGMWNYSLHQALDDLGYLYTSDFGIGVSGFPFFPFLNGVKSSTLQIPVNPFSCERAAIWRREEEKQEITPEFVADFFLRIIDDNYREEYPILLYSHPEKFGSMADYVFERINQKIENMNIWKTTYTNFANWWMRRDKVTYSVECDQHNRIKVIGDMDSDIRVKEV